ncbi:hypothetical protein AMATHDRAFT_134378 [Amanita thiersii Skay4041]|uniref:DH domain-containing protein n=1 Tax=Amanita thiersii Skay4041 TaxID=703135 RepID=A0A2A9P1N0_9AGAR|nr:hypothetical protein AMATHDRAFT_134378 [Amanita thiersii Skay4041]
MPYSRPRAPTPSTSVDPDVYPRPLASICPSQSPSSPLPPADLPSPPPLSPAHSMPLPDPALFPDPYPFRTPHLHHPNSLPALSSAGSSSASARSSAYTSSGSALASGDYGHIHVASGDEDSGAGVGISSDAVIQMLASEQPVPSRRSPASKMSSLDQSRSSDSRSSLSTNISSPFLSNDSTRRLQQKPSYDMSWQTVDERDELGISEDETDDDAPLLDNDPDIEDHEERTSAAVMADEGRGLIVQAGTVPLVQLQSQVLPGTTHLLLGSCTTPNAMPVFLTNILPQISHSLLALDISANFLSALPPVLAICENLEELNVASNPLRVLPVFLADLTNLRVLIADSTGISTLPETLVDLERLHTISIKRNKLHALPSWLCLLNTLQTLCVDGNPFHGPWKALVEPLLAKTPMSPSYPPSTPIFSPSHTVDTETDATDLDDLSDKETTNNMPNALPQSPDEEDNTITPERAPYLSRAKTLYQSEDQPPPSQPPPRSLVRTRTTPNRAYFDQIRTKNGTIPDQRAPRASVTRPLQEDSGYLGDHELRKMKSAGDLRRPKIAAPGPGETDPPGFVRPTMSQYSASQSSSNLLSMNTLPSEVQPVVKRFASLGPSSSLSSSPQPSSHIAQSSADNISENEDDTLATLQSNRTSLVKESPPKLPPKNHELKDGKILNRQRPPLRDGKEKSSRWGFLKKMSMGKIKSESPTQSPTPPSRQVQISRPQTSTDSSSSIQTRSPDPTSDRISKMPQIDLRFSTTGSLDALSSLISPNSPPQIHKKLSQDLLKSSPPPPPAPNPLSPTLLAPPTTRSSKRRSFLPVDGPGSISLMISDSSLTGPDSTSNAEDSNAQNTTPPSVVTEPEQSIRREEERARESYMRALRSVMAYLRDMNDLGMSQQSNTISIYGSPDDSVSMRPRRLTGLEREVSMALSGTTAVASIDSAGQLRSAESIARIRSGTCSQTLSVATTDSSGSVEERKFKDDRGKRAMVIREIVLTERTYVQGLQDLADIYIKPASVTVNILSGVGSSRETIVPSSERKIVFGGLEALFSFHKDSFLPALETAAAPVMRSSSELQEVDADGQLSIKVARDVGNMFLKHAAFMRMYSTYINNFDSSVQRIKYWTSDRSTGGGASLSPSSSAVQLAGLGLSMSAISSPSVLPDAVPTSGVPTLTTSQRKRIKAFLKRCRLNPRHTQLNLEGYLLLPVQRIPRYRLLLEELLRSTPPSYDFMDDPLERALGEIASLANNMNEGKREAESRRKLVKWQARIKGKFPSPLVQPHRRLIMDGPLLLTRVVRKATVSFEAINAQGDTSTVQVDCLAPELTPRPLMGILCNDLLVLCRDPSDGKDPSSSVDLWAVLRMQTLPQPASIVHGNVLRLVDNKAILYFDAPSPSDALNWYRAINLHIPASKG